MNYTVKWPFLNSWRNTAQNFFDTILLLCLQTNYKQPRFSYGSTRFYWQLKNKTLNWSNRFSNHDRYIARTNLLKPIIFNKQNANFSNLYQKHPDRKKPNIGQRACSKIRNKNLWELFLQWCELQTNTFDTRLTN